MTTWPKVALDIDRDEGLCFGCGRNNPIGLKLDFQKDGETARAEFTPGELYQGWPGMVHGGIILCLLDEAVSWIALLEGMSCITAEFSSKLRHPAPINELLLVTASVTKKSRKLVKTQASVSLKDGTLIAEATATQFVVQPDGKENNDSK